MTTQKAIEAITKFREVAHGHAVLAEALDMAIEALSAQTEIIRCKYCKSFEECDKVMFWYGEDDFCSRAERRTDETD